MSADKTFMGRVFLPPAPSAELHINIGFNTVGNQAYPEWMPIFKEAISKKDYDRMIGKIKAYLDENAMPMYCVSLACCCFPIGLPYLYVKTGNITSGLQQIGNEFNGARVELCQMSTPTGLTADMMAFDQYGQAPMTMFGGSDRRAGEMKPCWPPLGYNIILKTPQSFNLRNAWPKFANLGPGLGNIPMQQMMLMQQGMQMQNLQSVCQTARSACTCDDDESLLATSSTEQKEE